MHQRVLVLLRGRHVGQVLVVALVDLHAQVERVLPVAFVRVAQDDFSVRLDRADDDLVLRQHEQLALVLEDSYLFAYVVCSVGIGGHDCQIEIVNEIVLSDLRALACHVLGRYRHDVVAVLSQQGLPCRETPDWCSGSRCCALSRQLAPCALSLYRIFRDWTTAGLCKCRLCCPKRQARLASRPFRSSLSDQSLLSRLFLYVKLGFVIEFSSEGLLMLQALWMIGWSRMTVTLSENEANIIWIFELSNSTM